ncbi:hypothetical protein D3C81_1109450 [compost metagenome]
MVGIYPQVGLGIALFQLGTVFWGDRYAQAGKIHRRMPWLGTAFEQCQAVPGVGLAEQQILPRREATVAADDIDAALLQGLLGIVVACKRNNFDLQVH